MSGILYPGGSTPIPLCPSRRIRARPERAWMRLPSVEGEGRTKGGSVSSPIRQQRSLGKSGSTFPDISCPKFETESRRILGPNALAAFSFEFVAKPEQAAGATLILPTAIQSGLEDVAGFAGSLVMVSGQEARLITVIIFWEGSEARRNGTHVERRVRALLAPFLDRCLRVQNLLAHLPTPQNPQPSSIDTDFIADESMAQEANVCVA
jgi:hypothetical protein